MLLKLANYLRGCGRSAEDLYCAVVKDADRKTRRSARNGGGSGRPNPTSGAVGGGAGMTARQLFVCLREFCGAEIVCVEEVIRLFRIFDEDGNNVLTTAELVALVAALQDQLQDQLQLDTLPQTLNSLASATTPGKMGGNQTMETGGRERRRSSLSPVSNMTSIVQRLAQYEDVHQQRLPPPTIAAVYPHYLRLRTLMKANHWGPRDVYHRIDVDARGSITAMELKRGLQMLYKGGHIGRQHSSITVEHADEIIRYIDTPQQGSISMIQFESWSKELEVEYSRQRVRAKHGRSGFYQLWKAMVGLNLSQDDLFAHFDENDDGGVTLDELQRGLLAMFEDSLTAKEIRAMFEAVDTDGNGDISKEEWINVVLKEMHRAVRSSGTGEEIQSLALGTKRRNDDGGFSPLKSSGRQRGDSDTRVDSKMSIPDTAWTETVDETTGKTYWYNTVTRKSLWKQPEIRINVATVLDDSEKEGYYSDSELQDVMGEDLAPPDPERVYDHYIHLQRLMRERHLGPREIYRRIDMTGEGAVTIQGLKRGLQMLYKDTLTGCLVLRDEAAEIVRSITRRGAVTMVEFEEWCVKNERKFKQRYAVARAAQDSFYRLWQYMRVNGLGPDDIFEMFDTDHGGSLSFEELEKGMGRSVREPFESSELRAMFDTLDMDGSQDITPAEWGRSLTKEMRGAVRGMGTHEEIRALKDGPGSPSGAGVRGGGGGGAKRGAPRMSMSLARSPMTLTRPASMSSMITVSKQGKALLSGERVGSGKGGEVGEGAAEVYKSYMKLKKALKRDAGPVSIASSIQGDDIWVSQHDVQRR